jgi:hypothetical protein
MNLWLKWRIWRDYERTRAVVVASLIVSAAFLAAFLTSRETTGSTTASRMVLGYWASMALGIKSLVILSSVWQVLRGRERRPGRFYVGEDAFTVPTMRAPWVAAADHVLFGGFLIGIALDVLLPPSGGVRLDGLGVTSLAGVIAVVAFTYFAVRPLWQGNVLTLTPTGITYRTPFTDRVVPWEALPVGEPARRPVRAALLMLPVAKPELVMQEGPRIGGAGKRRLLLPMDFNVHPWFLTDAIRYYVGHPQSRTAIGTEAEHDRLRASFAK